MRSWTMVDSYLSLAFRIEELRIREPIPPKIWHVLGPGPHKARSVETPWYIDLSFMIWFVPQQLCEQDNQPVHRFVTQLLHRSNQYPLLSQTVL
ncbi:hypothetical protein AVEN_103481-1 [Araneus ventricosus]|uniref:Uncharacterized protein n=1 Tax=Araneus ventricosus TaxID=182803 RepID=A0A4Y2J2G3_ARAVE|nr:hypothetical protein AVEN_103481-1 [Araneus ventricosus]